MSEEFLPTKKELRIVEEVAPYTMTSGQRITQTIRAVRDLDANNIPGDIVEFVSNFASGKLKPTIKENFIGKAEVLQIFKVSKIGAIAGCRVVEGSVNKNARVKVTRNEKTIYDGDILSLKREKNEANEVKSGTECGISIKEFNDFEVGDFIEAFSIEEIAQSL